MRRFTAGVVLGFAIAAFPVYAGLIPDPPPIQDKQALLYLRRISANWMRMPVVTTNPDGSQRGLRGDYVLLDTNGATDGPEYIEVCTSVGPGGGTQWRGVALSDVP